MPHDLGELVQAAKRALRDGQPREALALLREIEGARPGDPIWPRRQAEIHRKLGNREQELEALLRTSRLLVDAGEVMQAMATCKQILAIDDQHSETLDRLHLLYMVPQRSGASKASPAVRAPVLEIDPETEGASQAPLAELLLTDTLPGTRKLQLSEPDPNAISEIPLDSESEVGQDLDLELSTLDAAHPFRAPQRAAVDAFRDDAFSGESTQNYLLKCALLGMLEPTEVRDLLRKVEMIDIGPGEVLFHEGDPADRLYVVVDGAVVPIAETESRVRMGVLECGDFFGEIGLISNQPRNATVESLVETRLLAIDRPIVWALLRRHPEVLKVLLRTLRERLVDRLIRTSPLFSAFAAAKRSAVARQFRMLEVRSDKVLVEQGLPNQGLFVVLSGTLEVVQRGAGGDKSIASLGHGEVFGEMSILYDAPANARILSRSKCWLLFLSHERFVRIAKRNPGLIEFVRTVAESRYRENWERVTGDSSAAISGEASRPAR